MVEAGYPNGFKLRSMHFRTHNLATHELWKEAAWEYLNVDIAIDILEPAVVTVRARGRDFDARNTRNAAFDDPDEYLYGVYHKDGNNNYARWDDPVSSEFAEKQRTTMDREEQIKLVRDA